MKPFQEGYKDFLQGQISNPYPVNTSKHQDWQFGFNKAYFKNLEIVQRRENGQTKKTN